MKITRIICLILTSIVLTTACDIDLFQGGVIYNPENNDDNDDDDTDKGPNIITNVTLGTTVSYTNPAGINLKYKIENTVLELGDTLIIQIDSDNEIKPYVRLAINNEEVVYTADLPITYDEILDEKKDYELVFSVYDDKHLHQFDTSTTISIK